MSPAARHQDVSHPPSKLSPPRQRAFNIIEKTRTILSFSQGSDEAVEKVEGGAEGEPANPAAKVSRYDI